MRPIPMELTTLDTRTLAMQARITGEMLNHLTTEFVHHFMGDLLVNFRSKAVVRNLPPETITHTQILEVDVPSSWWQMWKRDHAPLWIERRWPVRTVVERHELTVTVDLRRFHVYPDAPPINGFGISVPNHTMGVRAKWTVADLDDDLEDLR